MNEGREQGVKHTEGSQSDAHTVHGQGSGKVLHDRAMAATGNLDRIHQSQEIVANQHDLGALAGDLRTRSHGNTDRCLHQCRRIVDSIPEPWRPFCHSSLAL